MDPEGPATWLMDPDGPATWLVTLELNPAAISLCAIVIGPNGAVRHRWLRGGSTGSRKGYLHRGLSRLLGGTHWYWRPGAMTPLNVQLKNTEAIPLFYKNTDQKWTVFSKKLILDKYKFIYSEKCLQGL